LVKNSFDADAKKVDIYFKRLRRGSGTVIIEDDGAGMNREELF